MKITWDEAKRLADVDRCGLDFSDLTLDFFREFIGRADQRRSMRSHRQAG